MFHLFNKVYIDNTFMFDIKHDFFAISKKWANVTLPDQSVRVLGTAKTLEELVKVQYDNDIERFWEFILSQQERVHLYMDHDERLKLQVQFWKSIFDKLSQEFVYLLHKFYVANSSLGQYRHRQANEGRDAHLHANLPLLSQEAFVKLYNETSPSATLEKMDKTVLGFEYLLGHYLATRKRTTNVHYHQTFFDRFGDMMWRRWLIEMDILREQVLDVAFQWNDLFTDMNTDDVDFLSLNFKQIFASLGNNEDLSWLTNSSKDVEQLKATFDPERFTRMYKALHVNPYPYTDNKPSPLEYLTKLKNGAWEELFDIELARKFGSSITQTYLSRKSNGLLVSYLYSEGRKSTVGQLKDFILKSP